MNIDFDIKCIRPDQLGICEADELFPFGLGTVAGCGMTGDGTFFDPLEIRRAEPTTGPSLGPLPTSGFKRDKLIANDPCATGAHSTNFQLLVPDSDHGIAMGGTGHVFANDGTLGNSAILSGNFNSITTSISATICGGGGQPGPGPGGSRGNTITSSAGSSIGGGTRNSITDGGSHRIGGGTSHTIDSNGGDTGITIAGGLFNTIDGITNSLTVTNSIICGGTNNVIRPVNEICNNGFIGGGTTNVLSHTVSAGVAYNSCIVGGRQNTCDAPHSTIGGGDNNTIDNSIGGTVTRHATIAGGVANLCGGNFATVGGGGDNRAVDSAVVCGGGGNPGAGNSALGAGSSILGGINNGTSAAGATVLGGSFNNANGVNSIAGGSSATAATSRSVCISCDSGGGTTTLTGEFQIVLGTDGATPALVVLNMPSGAGAPPVYLPSGGIWRDTAAADVLKIVP